MSATAVTDEVLRQRLMRFYRAYAPEKIANVDKVVDLYRHRVPELFASLEEKYGPEPSAAQAGSGLRAPVMPEQPEPDAATCEPQQAHDSPRSAIASGPTTPRRMEKKRSIRFAAPSEPADENPAAAAAPPAQAPAADEEGAPEEAAPAPRRPPPPIPPLAVHQQEAGRQAQQHQQAPPATHAQAPPQHAAAAVASPPSHQHNASQEAAASPMPDEDDEERPLTPHNIPPLPDAELRKRERVKQRLIAFYQHYAPEKVASVDVALSAYRGREGAMFSLLEAKYGPEAAVYDDEGDSMDEAGKDQRRLRQMINASIAASPHARSAGMGDSRKADAPAFDHIVAAQLLGSSVDLQMFGHGNEKFAAAFVLMLHAIGPNALFDATHAKLPMPALPDREPSALDRFAFERILHFRFVWIDAWFKGLAIRNHELADRRAIADDMAATLRETRYREYVRVQAVAMINPIEADRRQLIQQEQALRFSGLLTWFRKNRDELLLDKIRATADVIISSPKKDAGGFAASPMRNVLTQEQSEVQKVLRSAGEALRRSTNRRPSASPNGRRATSPNAAGASSTDRRVAGASPMQSTRGVSGGSIASPASPAAGGFSARLNSSGDRYPSSTSQQRRTSPERRGVSVALSLDMSPHQHHHHQRTDAHGSSGTAPALSTARSPAASSRFATHRSDAAAYVDPRASSPYRPASTSRSASAAAQPPNSSMSFLTRARRVAGARGQFSNHGGANSPAASRRSVSSRSVSAASTAVPPLY
jgi:hypothetical protein